ncbi:MAG: hypothetical protein RMI90_09120 [Thermoguttaceae bacterium]|nr:hypothetical protein [Thermoguttaceae bacterium]
MPRLLRGVLTGGMAFLAALSGGIASAEIIGPALINRGNVDTGFNYMFLYDTGTATPGFTHWGFATSWAFYNDNGTAQCGRQVEPVILKKVGTESWVITGVGQPITTPATMSGVQSFPFILASGSSVVGPGYTFAHRDLNNAGSIEFDFISPGTHRYLGRGSNADVVGDLLSGFSTPANRIYSIQFTTQNQPMVPLGNPLINRATDDGDSGIFIHTQEFSFWAPVVEWAFYDNDNFTPDRQITPLILEKVGNNYIIRGIGQTRTTTERGEQHYLFDVVAGSNMIGPGYYFGWWTGAWANGQPTATNAGVIDFDTLASGTLGILWFQTPGNFGLGTQLTATGQLGVGSFHARMYSVEVTLAVPEPASALLASLALGAMVGLVFVRRRVRSK